MRLSTCPGVQRSFSFSPLRLSVLAALGGLLARTGSAVAAPPPASDALTEGAAASWGASADSATASVFDDSARVKVGTKSLRLETTAPFDCRIWAPIAKTGHWDVASAGGPAFWLYAENPSPYGFQENSPWVRLATDASNYVDYRASSSAANDARGQWVRVSIPLSGNANWARTVTGSPSLSDINYVEIHADTWDAGFKLWIDDFGFTTPLTPPQGLSATAGNASVTLSWQKYVDPTGQFNHYAIYRSTAAFTSTLGRTPLTTIGDINTTTYTDNTPINGTTYYYAVTAVFNNGFETTNVTSVGPVQPRNETDLQFVCIARTPRFPRYAPNYTNYTITEPSGFGPYNFSAATSLGSGQTAGTQRWPSIGQAVTYTATVRNRGTNTWAPAIHATWRLDGNIVSQPTKSISLAPGEITTFAYVLNWDGAGHDIQFTVDEADARAGNNTSTINTKSVGYLTYIDRGFYEQYHMSTAANYPQAATDDLIDWLNRHMVRFNQMFADAGTAKRVHYDVLEMLADGSADPGLSTIYFAIFPYRYHATDGEPRLSGYYHASEDLDYGLLHEMGHQLGLIDLYRLDMSAEANQVSGQGYSALADLMNGVSPFLSAHSAGAMNLWLDKAHGYYGQYLYGIPSDVRLKLLGFDGKPLVGATVKMYQKSERPGLGEVITNQIKAQSTTDANGEWMLPNVPIDPAKVPPDLAGDVLHDNPFGYVAVVGTNGVMHFRVEYNGAIDYCWLDITDCNIAYFQGQTQSATFTRQLGLGGPVQYIPPSDLTELNAADWSALAEGSDSTGTYVQDDLTRKITGAGSLKFITNGGFDTYVRYPQSFTSIWNLTGVQKLKISFYAENQQSFQNGSPWIRLKDADGNYFQYQYYINNGIYDLLNESLNNWKSYEIPLDASPTTVTGWRRTSSGSPDITRMQYVEIHADTWGAGFTLWIDGVSFSPQPLRADFNRDGVVNVSDRLIFENCITGPLLGPPSAECVQADLDGDLDVDQVDFGKFQRCLFNGVSGCDDD